MERWTAVLDSGTKRRMTAAYRTNAPLCPRCHEPLEAHTTSAPAVVDLCKRCGGVWIDWEDGDLTALAREVPPVAARLIPRDGPGGCPRCHRELSVEVFLDAAEILRCSECAGAFVPYASIGKIAASTPADAREEPSATPNMFARAVAVLKSWIATG